MRRPHLSDTYDVTMFRETFESRFTYLNGFFCVMFRVSETVPPYLIRILTAAGPTAS